MKALAYVLIAAGFTWAAFLAYGESAGRAAPAPAAALIGIGFALLTVHSVNVGSVRGAQRRIHRDERPTAFWLAIVIWGLASLSLIGGGMWLWAGG